MTVHRVNLLPVLKCDVGEAAGAMRKAVSVRGVVQGNGPVIGVAWDGTGYGTDGHIWDGLSFPPHRGGDDGGGV